MKIRSKDTVGRQQKGFFGRQRLDLLSKGLCTSNTTEIPKIAPFLSSRGAEDIEFAHARQKISVDDVILRSYIPSPIRVSPSTPRSHKRTRKEAHTSSSGTRHSRALEALDTLERQCIVILDIYASVVDEILLGKHRLCGEPWIESSLHLILHA
jgi:hypothetical protein